MKELKGSSKNITEENISAMKQLFPEAFAEGKIDFDVLRQLLGDFVDDENERYSFKWNGKGRALRLSQSPSMGTLRPWKEESKDWDTTKNLYIEGDNFEVLKLLQKSYYGKVKMIYIDPPYNTGNDFVYKDDFRDNIENYKRMTGQIDGEGHYINTNQENNGRFHTDWLNMMYPRLRLARNLLADDGVIFISIDDNENSNLRKICDEIFGELNFRNQIVVRRGAKSLQAQFNTWDKLGQGYESILLYTKSASYRFTKQMKSLKEPRSSGWNNHWRGTNRPTMRYELFGIIPEEGQWRWSEERSRKAIENYDRMLAETKMTLQHVKQNVIDAWYDMQIDSPDLLRLSALGKPEHYIPPTYGTLLNNVWMDLLVGSSSEIVNVFDSSVFDTAKLTPVIKRMLSFARKDALILDFFSGSATTAHAVMQLNAEDGGNRRFIMVQIPEPTAAESEAAKAGYTNICEIGKERIRRAGEKIKAETGEKAAALDVGFKVFKLDTSNLKKWNPDPENLQLSLQEATENFVPGRTELDVVYEILLKMGLELSAGIEERTAAGQIVYVIGGGVLIICLGSSITLSVVEEIVRLHAIYNSACWKVVFRDTGFASDMDKTNSKETLRAAGLSEDSFVCV